jgi:protein-tyrosine-phosphatase
VRLTYVIQSEKQSFFYLVIYLLNFILSMVLGSDKITQVSINYQKPAFDSAVSGGYWHFRDPTGSQQSGSLQTYNNISQCLKTHGPSSPMINWQGP